MIIAVANQKGGVAKTTTTIHLGVALARRGRRVLLIDLDPQAHIGEGLGLDYNIAEGKATNWPDISDVIEGKTTLSSVTLKTEEKNLDVAPSSIRLSDMELTLVNMPFRETKLRKALEPVKDQYDFIFIDCPPNLGMLTINALMASDQVLIPMSSEYYSMLGVASLIKTINVLKEANQNLKVMGIIHTRVKHTNHAKEVIERTTNELQGITVFKDAIFESTRFMEAAGLGKTVFDTAGEIPGALSYLKIAKEIDDKYSG